MAPMPASTAPTPAPPMKPAALPTSFIGAPARPASSPDSESSGLIYLGSNRAKQIIFSSNIPVINDSFDFSPAPGLHRNGDLLVKNWVQSLLDLLGFVNLHTIHCYSNKWIGFSVSVCCHQSDSTDNVQTQKSSIIHRFGHSRRNCSRYIFKLGFNGITIDVKSNRFSEAVVE
ncbi:hypothetical protein OGATHE_001462 [Ogataea polymorpha]|uniref:Uncharacterized protein n=1 Tax=Ogataea polymorpha TaxID=460523 RepID=A0A9P8PRV9_9ASCO|nr:hypothetical protein OGATHE_001462 [Ogataea polymorpha]